MEALQWAVSLTRNSGLREAIKSWRERSRNHKIARMTAELIHGYRREIIRLEQCTQELGVQLRESLRRCTCDEWGSRWAGVRVRESEVERVGKLKQGMEAVVRDLEAQLEQVKLHTKHVDQNRFSA